jgi:hypothetical protein
MCILIAIGGGRLGSHSRPIIYVALLIEKATLGARQDAPVENSRLSIVS